MGDAYFIRKHRRAFGVYDDTETLVCFTLYLRGAFEVIRRLGGVAFYDRNTQEGNGHE